MELDCNSYLLTSKNIFSSSDEINFEEMKQMIKSDSFQNSLIAAVKAADNEFKKHINNE